MSKKKKQHIQFPAGLHCIDSHCHLVGLEESSNAEYDVETIIERASTVGVVQLITIGIDLDSSTASVALAQKHPHIHATIGIHPNNVNSITDTTYATLKDLYKKNSAVVKGFGEIGLDYYRNNTSPKQQKEHFAAQLELAEKLNLPVVIHNRNADDDCLAILNSYKREAGCVMHCFSSDYAIAKKIIDMGMYISLSGVVTFKNAPKLHEVAKKIPLDRLLVETDAPFLAPEPFRGSKNEPAHVRYTINKIAELRNVSIEEIADTLYHNTTHFFHLQDAL